MTAPQHSEAEARDAYVAVEMTLSNGRKIRVRPPLFDEAIPILLQLDGFLTGAPVAGSLVPALQAFEELTGVPRAELTSGQGVMDVFRDLQRFFYLPRSANGAAAETPAAPAPSSPAS